MVWIKRWSGGVSGEIRVFLCVCVCVWQVGGEGKGQESREFKPAFQETQSSRSSIGCPSDGLVVIWTTSNPRPHPSIYPSHTPLPLLSISPMLPSPRVCCCCPPPRRAHLQVCEGRSPTKADCVLIKFIICRELILKGNLSPLVLKESWITHLL